MQNIIIPIAVALITGVVAPIVVQYFHRRSIVKQAKIRGDSEVVMASIKSWDDLVAHYASLIHDLRDEIVEYKVRYASLKDDYHTVLKELGEIKAKYEFLRRELEQTQTERDQLKDRITALEGERLELKREIHALQNHQQSRG